MERSKIQNLLDSLDEGILGTRKDWQVDASNRAIIRNKSRIGKPLSELTKSKISQTSKGKRPKVLDNKEALQRRAKSHHKVIGVYTKEGVFVEKFNSAKECGAKYGNTFHAVMRGQQKYHKGFFFKHL